MDHANDSNQSLIDMNEEEVQNANQQRIDGCFEDDDEVVVEGDVLIENMEVIEFFDDEIANE